MKTHRLVTLKRGRNWSSIQAGKIPIPLDMTPMCKAKLSENSQSLGVKN